MVNINEMYEKLDSEGQIALRKFADFLMENRAPFPTTPLYFDQSWAGALKEEKKTWKEIQDEITDERIKGGSCSS